MIRKFVAVLDAGATVDIDARDLVDPVVDVAVDAEDRRRPSRVQHSTMAMTIRPESARTAARGDLTVRSWYRGAPARRVAWGPANGPDGRGARLVPWAGAPRRPRRVRAGQQPAARCRGDRGASRPFDRRRGGTGGGAGRRRVPIAFAALDALAPGFWVGWCSFELGHAAERVVARGASTEPATVPDLVFARFDALAVIDPRGGIRVRRRRTRPRPPRPRGRGAAHRSVQVLRSRRRTGAAASTVTTTPTASPRCSTCSRAGECYQVNLTRRLTCDDAIDPIALYRALAHAHPAPHARAPAPPGARRGDAPSCRRRRSGTCGCVTATSRRGRSRAPRRPAPRCAPAARTTPRT